MLKRVAFIMAMSLVGFYAQAQEPMGDVDATAGKVWACGLKFSGTSHGLKVIVGHFKTVGHGTLSCKSVFGESYSRHVNVTIGHHWIGPTAGIGYFKLRGVSSEISLLNHSPNAILGNYLVAQGEAAIVGGVGAFTAVKVGMPQLAVNISLQLLKGFGVQVGIDRLSITAAE